jgi:hypothetical protein
MSLLAALPVAGQERAGVQRDAPPGLAPDHPPWPLSAELSGPVAGHPHDVLGGIPAFSVLSVTALGCGACRNGFEGDEVTLPRGLVFEDVAPRLWDVTGDGLPEIVVVEATADKGARLAVWAYGGRDSGRHGLHRLAETAFIGQGQRWLAPAAAADFDGDGQIEIAYVDRPHLLRELVFLRLEAGRLTEIARLSGLTDHRIGDRQISAALRDCDGAPEVVLADAGWQRLVAVGWQAGGPVARDLGPFSAKALERAADCG